MRYNACNRQQLCYTKGTMAKALKINDFQVKGRSYTTPKMNTFEGLLALPGTSVSASEELQDEIREVEGLYRVDVEFVIEVVGYWRVDHCIGTRDFVVNKTSKLKARVEELEAEIRRLEQNVEYLRRYEPAPRSYAPPERVPRRPASQVRYRRNANTNTLTD